ncbi:MAG: glycoside hydrolase family 15 protein [Gammaproteobacteria bacterium]|nr:glycoside hydrolase family 15 protein [Gammaproteobacteria bacterium]
MITDTESPQIADYAFISNTTTGALVGRNGSIDWYCPSRIDAAACFAALLGGPQHGYFQIAPTAAVTACTRRYQRDTMILETDFETAQGAVRLIDFMPLEDEEVATSSHIIRIVEGLQGRVEMALKLVIRFYYGSMRPWIRETGSLYTAVAGPDSLDVAASVPLHAGEGSLEARFALEAGQRAHFRLSYRRSHHPYTKPFDIHKSLHQTVAWWRTWTGQCSYQGPWRDEVVRSLLTLKALTSRTTGGIAAALTTSLPERIGGTRNWDYRFCWLRDSTFTLWALLRNGYRQEGVAWGHWLLRAVAGDPADLQIVYGVSGERWLAEREIPWLNGYRNSRPVRVGNAASGQFQIDVYGEIMDSLHVAQAEGIRPEHHAWDIQLSLMDFLESHWQKPDDGIWEVRGGPRHFTHSKMMAWVAFDRAVKDARLYHPDAPIERWTRIRDAIHAEVCEHGFDKDKNSFTQYYGSPALDSSLLMMPLVGFLPACDPRVRGTVEAIERELMEDGLVLRYHTNPDTDGLPEGEGLFLPCSFWLVDNLVLQDRREEAERLFERLLGLRNDVGLLSEEYDPRTRELVGNIPQAFTHVGLINSARNLAGDGLGARRARHGEATHPKSA